MVKHLAPSPLIPSLAFWSDHFGIRLQSMGMPDLADLAELLDPVLHVEPITSINKVAVCLLLDPSSEIQSLTFGSLTLSNNIVSPEKLELQNLTDNRGNLAMPLHELALPVERWHEAIANPTIADASLDHLEHNAHRLLHIERRQSARSCRQV